MLVIFVSSCLLLLFPLCIFSRKITHLICHQSEDPYNFDSVTAPDSTPAAKRPKHATIDGSSSEVAAAEVEHESESIPVQQHEAGSTQGN